MIKETLEYIFAHTGLELEECKDFPGIRKNPHGHYFSVTIRDRVWCSQEYVKLERLALRGRIKVAPNGLRRISITVIKEK